MGGGTRKETPHLHCALYAVCRGVILPRLSPKMLLLFMRMRIFPVPEKHRWIVVVVVVVSPSPPLA